MWILILNLSNFFICKLGQLPQSLWWDKKKELYMINNIHDREQDKGVVLIGRIQKKLWQPQLEKNQFWMHGEPELFSCFNVEWDYSLHCSWHPYHSCYLGCVMVSINLSFQSRWGWLMVYCSSDELVLPQEWDRWDSRTLLIILKIL